MLTLLNFVDSRKRNKERYKKIVVYQYRKNLEIEYYAWLRKLVQQQQQFFENIVVKSLGTAEIEDYKAVPYSKASQEEQKRPKLSTNAKFRKVFSRFKKAVNNRFPDTYIEKVVRKYINKMAKWENREFNKRLKSFGIDLAGTNLLKQYKSYLTNSIEANLQYVKDLKDDHQDRLQGIVFRAFAEGRTLKSSQVEIQKALNTTKTRAATIARTEVNKLTNRLSDKRAEEVGIEEGIWRTMKDNRVRDRHEKFEGKRFDINKGLWDPEQKKWVRPGDDPNCRCYTEYIV